MNLQLFKTLLAVCLPFILFAQSRLPELKQLEKLQIQENNQLQKIEMVFNFRQPLDHQGSVSDSFDQKIVITHRGYDGPAVLITEGYALKYNYCAELAELMKANEIRIEHRFFGESVADSLHWQFLNIKQSSDDYHRIIESLKPIYRGPWLTTGWSKGGQTAIYHRYFYPKDVKASVIYDSPMNFSVEEKSVDDFFETVGDENIRKKLIQFQRMVLQQKSAILHMFKTYCKSKKYTFSIGYEMGLEYAVLEYPFSFWQYNDLSIDDIPGENATPYELFNHLRNIVSFSSYSDKAMNSPSMFQFCTELGYYGYVQKHVADLLSQPGNYKNCRYAPQVPELKFNSEIMPNIQKWLDKSGNHFIYIYGDRDPWSGPQIHPSANVNSKKYILPAGNHFTFIRNFDSAVQNKILHTLNDWLLIK